MTVLCILTRAEISGLSLISMVLSISIVFVVHLSEEKIIFQKREIVNFRDTWKL